MRVIALVGDAFGGQGGIAKFNRELLTDLTTHPAVDKVVAIPRIISDKIGELPPNLDYRASAANNKGKYLSELLRIGFSKSNKGSKTLVICGHIHLLPLAFLLRWLTRGQLVLVIHGIEAWRPLPRALPNFCARSITRFISVSELTGARFRAWTGLSKACQHLLPNCIDLTRFTPGPKNPELLERYGLENARTIMTLGRMAAKERYKGFDEVLEAMPAMIQTIPNLKYLLIGDGNDRPRLEQKAKDLLIRDYVIFAGKIPEEEKVDHYRLSDAYVMPGSGEGFGIVYLEAMACGIPVVGSKIDGSREALREGKMGLLVDPTNPREVESSILNVLKQPRGNLPPGLEYFSRPQFGQRLSHVINEMLAGHEEG
jgi:phosphatidylinositol alpha-1,6-mannosyltransferase